MEQASVGGRFYGGRSVFPGPGRGGGQGVCQQGLIKTAIIGINVYSLHSHIYILGCPCPNVPGKLGSSGFRTPACVLPKRIKYQQSQKVNYKHN